MIEADLQRHYSVDLCDLWRGRLSLRKVRVLLEGLPADSRTAYALAEVTGPLSAWTLSDVLTGRLVDEIGLLRWQWESAHRDPDGPPHRPAPQSVLPTDQPRAAEADDIPVVSPHRLGGFINSDDLGGGSD